MQAMHSVTFVSVSVFFVCLAAYVAGACNRNALKVHYLRECSPQSNLKFPNMTVYLDKNCLVRLKGCVIVGRGYSEAKGKTEVKLNGVTIPISTDMCNASNGKKMINKFANMIGLRCPQKAGKVCANEGMSMDLAADTQKMGVSGETSLRTEVNHGQTVGKSCFEMKFTVNK